MKSFLTGGVPNLQNDSPILSLDLLVGKISTDGRLEVVSKAVMLEHLDQRCLADVGVTDDDDFDKMLAYVALLGLGEEGS